MLHEILKNKKLVIFDFDGTLSDSVWMWNAIDAQVIYDFTGIKVDESRMGYIRDYVLSHSKGEDQYAEYITYLKNHYGMVESEEVISQHRRNLMYYYLEHRIFPKPFAKELIELLNAYGIEMVLASTGTRDAIECVLNRNKNYKELRIKELFTDILTIESVSIAKPNPEIHNKIMEKKSYTKDEIVVIEDSTIGVGAAKNAELDVICVFDHQSSNDREQLMEKATYYVDSLDEICEFYRKKGQKMLKIADNQ